MMGVKKSECDNTTTRSSSEKRVKVEQSDENDKDKDNKSEWIVNDEANNPVRMPSDDDINQFLAS